MLLHARHRLRLEQVHVVAEIGGERVFQFKNGQREVEGRALLTDSKWLELWQSLQQTVQAMTIALRELRNSRGQITLHARFIPDEQRLNQWRIARIAFGLKLLDQQWKGIILMLQRLDNRLPHLRQQFSKGGITGKVSAQDDRISQVADDFLVLSQVTPQCGCTKQHIILVGIAIEQRREGGQHEREQRDLFILRQLLQTASYLVTDLKTVRRPFICLYHRTRLICWQVQYG